MFRGSAVQKLEKKFVSAKIWTIINKNFKKMKLKTETKSKINKK